MKFNREQIEKALECCSDGGRCNDCPYDSDCFIPHWGIVKDALALIRELTESLDRVRKQCGEIIVECDERDAERLKQVAKLTEENERLEAEREKLTVQRDTFREYAEKMQLFVGLIKHKEEDGYEPSAARYAAEMDMWHVVALEKKALTEENEKLGIKNFDLICELSRIKADTVRKMRKKLKLKGRNMIHPKYHIDCLVVSFEDIDQTAEELLEETK